MGGGGAGGARTSYEWHVGREDLFFFPSTLSILLDEAVLSLSLSVLFSFFCVSDGHCLRDAKAYILGLLLFNYLQNSVHRLHKERVMEREIMTAAFILMLQSIL
jgi:hypothetical protein